MKFIDVDNATDTRIVISQVRGADGRALTFEPKQLKVPVPQTCLSHPALIPYLRSVPPKLIPRPAVEVPVPAPASKPMPKPPVAPPPPAPAPAPPPEPEPEPEPAPEPPPPPVEEAVPETEAAAPESISEAIEEHATPKTGKKKKR